MSLQIAILLLAFVVLGYITFSTKDRWRRTFYALVLGNVLVGNAGVPIEVSYATTLAIALFFAVWLWQSHRQTRGGTGDRA